MVLAVDEFVGVFTLLATAEIHGDLMRRIRHLYTGFSWNTNEKTAERIGAEPVEIFRHPRHHAPCDDVRGNVLLAMGHDGR